LPGAPGAAGVAGDFDGDGIVDLARFGGEWSVDPQPRPIAIRKGRGDGTFDGPVDTAVTLALIGLRVMDVNGDHIDDLVSVEYDSPRQQVILGGRAGLRVLPPQTGLPCSGGGTGCLGPAADFDGNGTADFFVGRSLWLGGKDGVFTHGPSYEDYPHIPADINHDGRADLVGVSFDTPEVIYRAARNDGTFESAITLMSVAPYEGNDILILPADVTGDGIIDLVVSQPSSRVLMIGVGSAAGGFAPPTFYQPTVEDQVASSYGEGPQYDGTSVIFALEPPGPGGRDILLARADGELLVFPAMCTHGPR
jgi:hypothetical protein